MARIKLYPNDTTIEGGDKLVGTDINGNATKNYQIEELAQYFQQTTDPNLSLIHISEPRDRQKSRMPSSA